MNFLLRTLVWLGGLAAVFGGLAFCILLGYLTLFHGMPPDVAIKMAISAAIPAGIIGLAFDARWEFSSGIHKSVWREQQRAAREHLAKREISYRQALSKYYNAAYKLTQPPSLLSRLLSGQSDDVNKDELKNQLWVVKYTLKIIDPSYRPADVYDLDAWMVIVEELSGELAKAKENRGILRSWVGDWLSPEELARQVVDRWHQRRVRAMEREAHAEELSPQLLEDGETDYLAQQVLEQQRRMEEMSIPRANNLTKQGGAGS